MRKDKLNSVIFDNHQKFLTFVRSRVESGEVAEDILQSAYQKGLEKSEALRNDERVVAWFYRILRNAIIDHYRHRDVEKRVLTSTDSSVENIPLELNPQIEKAICKCMEGLIRDMKPEYADALKEVELKEQEIQSYAKKKGLSQNNAAVRLHRARQSLKKRLLETCGTCAKHACLNCHCRQV